MGYDGICEQLIQFGGDMEILINESLMVSNNLSSCIVRHSETSEWVKANR